MYTIDQSFGKTVFKILFLPPVGFDESNLPKISPWESTSQFILLAAAVYLGLNPPIQFVELLKESLMNLPI